MNRRLLTTLASAAILIASWTVVALTCEDKATSAQAAGKTKSATCTAEMAAKCTAAQAAACAAKNASAVTASADAPACAAHGAMSASASGCSGKSAAVTAGTEHAGCPFAKSAEAAACPHHMNGASMAAGAGCEHGAKGAGYDAAVTGGSKCDGHGMAGMSEASIHHDCDACGDMSHCDAEVRAAGGQTQVVKLKNGVMYVYSAGSPAQVRAVQAVMARRSDRLAVIAASGGRAKLCPECKVLRGAIASGKLNREIVTIEGGCLTLMTSNDPTIVARLHRMAGMEMAARVKS